MMSFGWQSVASMAVALIVWGRSEVILLKNLCPDIRQVAYYSVAFSMAERLLLGAVIFGSAASTTIFAQYGRDKSRLSDLAASSFRYIALTSIPLHLIFTALAVPALLLLFGRQYEGAAMVVVLAPLLCMPRAFIAPAQSLLESSERQSFVIAATALAGIVDIGVAWYLIPAHGAVGACLGNGAAQTLAAVMMWATAIYLNKVKLPWIQVAKISFISILAALTAHFIAIRFAPAWGILLGGSASAIVLFGLFYLMRVLEPEDGVRFNILTRALPMPIGRPLDKVLVLLVRADIASVTSSNE
jgi:O-antigen/teichoic acid export membrane protein